MEKRALAAVFAACAFWPWAACLALDFIVVGDMRQGAGNEQFQMTRAVINDAMGYVAEHAAAGEGPAGIVLTGDYVSDGGDGPSWESFRDAYDAAFAYPLYPCIGNHDVQTFSWTYPRWHYTRTFGRPRWYSVTVGPLHLVSLDATLCGIDLKSPANLLLEPLQYHWLQRDLRDNTAPFTVVIWHHPAYTSRPAGGGHDSNLLMRWRYVPVCEKFGVDLVICGHNHFYERTVPIRRGGQSAGGVVHVVTGGGGAPPYAAADTDGLLRDGRGNVLSAINASGYHFCVLSVDGNRLSLTAVEQGTRAVIDTFKITHSPQAP